MSSAALTISAVRSSGRRSFSEPLLARPMGERAAETITASGMGTPISVGVVGCGLVHPRRRRADGGTRSVWPGSWPGGRLDQRAEEQLEAGAQEGRRAAAPGRSSAAMSTPSRAATTVAAWVASSGRPPASERTSYELDELGAPGGHRGGQRRRRGWPRGSARAGPGRARASSSQRRKSAPVSRTAWSTEWSPAARVLGQGGARRAASWSDDVLRRRPAGGRRGCGSRPRSCPRAGPPPGRWPGG